ETSHPPMDDSPARSSNRCRAHDSKLRLGPSTFEAPSKPPGQPEMDAPVPLSGERSCLHVEAMAVDVHHGRPQNDLLSQGEIRLSTSGGDVVEECRPAETRCLRETDIPRDDISEHPTLEVFPCLVRHLLGEL